MDSAIKVMEAAKKLAHTTGYALDAASRVGSFFAIICSAGSILALWNVNKKHMKEIYLIHASWQSKVYLNLIRPFVSNKVFKKVVHAEKLEQLYDHIDQTEILVPPFVQEADDAMD